MKIKSLHVLGGLARGGAETLVVNILKNIDRDNYHFDFVIHHSELNDYSEIVKSYGCNIYVCPSFKIFNILSYKNWWKNFFKEHNDYQIIHGHVTSIGGIYLKIAKKYGIKTISHIHSVSYGQGFSGFVKRILSRKTKKYADIKIGCSKIANNFLYGNKNDCIVLPNGIEISKFKYNSEDRQLIRDKYSIDKNTLCLGTVGRIMPTKNPEFIVDISKRLLNDRVDFKFLWVGEGESKNQILKLIESNGLTNKFIFSGSIENVSPLLSAMDLFLFPSKAEGLGIALIEAQTNGLKCLASEVISDEAIISPLVKKLSIDNIETWCNIIKDNLNDNYDRTMFFDQINKTDYNIKNVVRTLSKIYNDLGSAS